MEPKKNRRKDVKLNSGLYFIAGLALVLLMAFVALEWKTYDKPDKYVIGLNNPDDLIDEQAPIFKLETPSTPEPPVVPPVIEIVDDDEKIDETFIGSSETDQEKEILEVSDIVFEEVPEDISIPISLVEEKPIFPGCENEKDKLGCFQKMIGRHISKYFRYPELQQEMGIQGKVYVQFVILKDGSIGNIKLRGPDKDLEAEAARIIGKLPKMVPGKQRGTAVKVPFSIPITFKLE